MVKKECPECGRMMDISMTSHQKGFWMCMCGNQQFEDFTPKKDPSDADKREVEKRFPLKFGSEEKGLHEEMPKEWIGTWKEDMWLMAQANPAEEDRD